MTSAAVVTIGDALAAARALFDRAGVHEARANAELLLAHALDTDRGGLFLRRGELLAGPPASRYAEYVRRRAAREPFQHVTGLAEFCGLALRADARALVPRPETEDLVQAVLECRPPAGARVVDLGTGSGCIAIALAVRRPDLELCALDASAAALALARENAERCGVLSRVQLVQGDLAQPPAAWRGCAAVVSNPPYVSLGQWSGLEPEVRDHDPRSALVAGPTGLECYAALAAPAHDLLRPGGHLLLELGAGQAAPVQALVGQAGFDVLELRRDPRGIDRVLVARRPTAAGGR